jgi:hypothetical protein
VVRIPSLTHRSTTVDDDNRPVSPGETAPVRERREDRATRTDLRRAEAERRAEADRAAAERAEADRAAVDQTAADRTATGRVAAEERAEPVLAGPRPRSSGLATVGLVLGVLAAAAVATGVLAAPGLALGVLATLFGVGGVSATGRRHVAGRSEALFAVVLGLASVVFAILALTDALSWLSSNTNEVSRLRDWLNDQMPWLDDL